MSGFDEWLALHYREATDARAVWQAAVRETTHLDAQLADDLGQIAALLARLEEHVTRYAAREEEVGSAYWHTEDPA